MGAKK